MERKRRKKENQGAAQKPNSCVFRAHFLFSYKGEGRASIRQLGGRRIEIMKTASCASCAKKASNRQTYTGSYRERKSCARRQDSSTSATSFSVTSSPLSFRRGRHRGLFKPFGFLLVALQFAFFCLLFSRAARGDDNREKHWAVVMDAGSSGTRAHVYTYTLPNETPSVYNERWSGGNRDTSKGASLPVFGEEETLKLRPGLSTYATNPAGSITEIEGLIDFVREHVPEEKRPTTPIILSATAGLRMVKVRNDGSLPLPLSRSKLERLRIFCFYEFHTSTTSFTCIISKVSLFAFDLSYCSVCRLASLQGFYLCTLESSSCSQSYHESPCFL